MKTKLLAVGICFLSLAACVGAEDVEMEADDEALGEAEQALCVTPPSLDVPSGTQSLALGTSESGSSVSRTSPDSSYASSGDDFYVTEITGYPVGGYANQDVWLSHAETPTTQSNCGLAKVEATYTCYDPAQGCWVDCGSSSALGTWITTPFGSYCDATTRHTIPAGYTKVRIKGKASTFALITVAPKKVTEGGSWTP